MALKQNKRPTTVALHSHHKPPEMILEGDLNQIRRREALMIKKISLIGVFMAILYFPLAAYGQDVGRSGDINITDVADNSIVVISQEETDIPGYVHEKYAFVSAACFPSGLQLVDYYGPPINPNDPSLLVREGAMCSDRSFDTPDD
jgi:hypothetical protein